MSSTNAPSGEQLGGGVLTPVLHRSNISQAQSGRGSACLPPEHVYSELHTVSRRCSEVKADTDCEGEGEEGEPEEEHHEPERPYQPPEPNYIRIEFGNSSTLVNHECKKKILVDFINSKMSSPINMSDFDLCDTTGNLAGLRGLVSDDRAEILFSAAGVYIPCKVELDDKLDITSIEPRLDNWKEKYPHMEGTIERIIDPAKGLQANVETLSTAPSLSTIPNTTSTRASRRHTKGKI